MEVKQIATLLNTVNTEVLGKENIAEINEDLSNIVTIGKDVTDQLTAGGNMDNYVKKILNRIGREINWNRPYISAAPNLLKDSWEFGSILAKNKMDLPEYTNNPSWTLTDGQDYGNFTFYQPDVSQKIFNKRSAVQANMSFAEQQFKESMTSAAGLNSFFSMIEGRVEDSMTLALDDITSRAINNFIGEKIHANNCVINLLALYNATVPTAITAANSFFNKDFQRFAAYTIALYRNRIKAINRQFNISEFAAHTPEDRQKLILLDAFAKGTEVFLQSDTYHNDLVKTGNYYTVSAWQGTKDYSFANITGLNVKTDSGATVTASGVVGVLFDEEAIAICCENRRVTSQYVPDGEFYTNFYKMDVMSINDLSENGIVFVVADSN